MNSKTKEREKAHRKATKLARTLPCVVCEMGPCVPAHWPTHRGMGSGKAGWEYLKDWLPMCGHHHDLVDRRLGVSKEIEAEREIAVRRIERYLQGRDPDPTEWDTP